MNRRIDFAGREWAAHAQDHWLEFAGNSNFPDYLRVTFVAYGRHAANGHAKLSRGELARYLLRKDGTLPDRRVVWRAIDTAVKLGYLRPESRQLCLVVSSHHVQGGRGNADARCSRDHTVKVRSERPQPLRTLPSERPQPQVSFENERLQPLRTLPAQRLSLFSQSVRQDGCAPAQEAR